MKRSNDTKSKGSPRKRARRKERKGSSKSIPLIVVEDEEIVDLTNEVEEAPTSSRSRRRSRRNSSKPKRTPKKSPVKKKKKRPPSNKFMPMPRYTIDLDTAPQDRWRDVATDSKGLLHDVVPRLEKHIVGKNRCRILLYHVVCVLLTCLCFLGYMTSRLFRRKTSLTAEVWGFSRVVGISPGKILVMQYVYEAATYCTSVVLNTKIPIHLRTMDWDMGFDMRPFTIQVDFIRRGVVLYRAVTWTGYFGILTAQKPEKFSVSVNYRPSSGYVFNISHTFITHSLIQTQIQRHGSRCTSQRICCVSNSCGCVLSERANCGFVGT